MPRVSGGLLSLLTYIVLFGLVYGTYLVNEPVIIAGVSLPFLYSLIVWLLLITSTIVFAWKVWR